MRILFKRFLTIFILSIAGRAHSLNLIEGWTYIPQHDTRYEKYEKLINEKKYTSIVSFLLSELKKTKKENVYDEAEIHLLLARTYYKMGIVSLAMEIEVDLLKKYPGSFISQAILTDLNDWLTQFPNDELKIQRILNSSSFLEVPKGTEDLIYFYTAIDNMKKKLSEWVKEPLSKVSESIFWGQKLRFYRALSYVKSNQWDEAEELFKGLQEDERNHEAIRKMSALQRARIFFEFKEYEKAEAIYSKFHFSGREMGQILLERAWTQYYQKNYGTSLGLLESLKAPYFNISMNPEQYILRMLIYRDLCHYPSVKEVSKEFSLVYKPIIEFIKKGDILEKNNLILGMGLQNPQFQNYADYINLLRKDLIKFETEFGADVNGILLEHQKLLKKQEILIRERLSRVLITVLEDAATKVVEAADQVKFIDYISGLDEFRIKQLFETRNYQLQRDEQIGYKIHTWPVKSEYWWDEFSQYQVLITDRCNSNPKKGNR